MSRWMIALFVTFAAAEAGACSCMPPVSVEAAVRQADAVFAGVVVSIEDFRDQPSSAAQPWGPERGRKVTFRVLQWWKIDDPTRTVELWTGFGGGDCGYPVEPAKSYLVFAKRDTRNQFAFGICGRTAALVCASKDVQALGDPIKTYETFDTASLIEREQPYTTYWRSCIEGPALLGERGLQMDRHCRFQVEGVIDREGIVRGFSIIGVSFPKRCPDVLRRRVTEQVAKWRFRPATIDGVPIETRLTTVSMREPITDEEHAKFLRDRAEWETKQKPR